MSGRRMRTRAPAGAPGRLRRATAGDRIYAYLIVGVVALLAAMALGPLQGYTAAADRVDRLVETRDLLQQEVDQLEERRERLHDPEEVELMARAQMGLVKPGEIPFVVVTPEPDLGRLHPDPNPDTTATGDRGSWYRQVGRWVRDLIA